MSNKYHCDGLDDGFKKIQEKGGVEEFGKFLQSIEMPFRDLYIKAFGTSAGAQIKDEYKDKLFRLEYDDGTTHDVGKLKSAGFRNYSCVTMFHFKFENDDGETLVDTETSQPKILMLN